MATLQYETAWRCVHCRTAGTVRVEFSEGCQEIWAAVIDAHTAQAPDCQKTSGLALQPAAAADMIGGPK